MYNLRVPGHFWPKISNDKIITSQKNFELYQVFMYNFLCQTLLIFPIYIYIYIERERERERERIGTFWSRDINSIWVLARFEPKIHNDFWNYMKSHSKLC